MQAVEGSKKKGKKKKATTAAAAGAADSLCSLMADECGCVEVLMIWDEF